MYVQSALMSRLFVIALLLVCSFSSSSQDDERRVSVAGAYWPGFLNMDGSGLYMDKIRSAFPADYDIRCDISEFVRARRLFLAQRADILVGVYRHSYPDKLYPSAPIDIENELRAYFVNGRTDITSVEDMEGKVLAWRSGYQFSDLVNGYVSHVDYEAPAKGFELLVSGKLDVVLDYEHNVPEALASQLDSIIVLPKEALWVAFQNTERGRYLLSMYEQGVAGTTQP